MKLASVKIKGFRSIESLELTLQDKGVTFVQGANGAGKSTIFEAIYWGLWGKPIKSTSLSDISTKTEYRTSKWEPTSVEVEFQLKGKSFRVTRTLSDLFIWVDAQLLPIENKADGQAKLEAFLGISSNLFQQGVFFAQKSLRLVDQKDTDKREILESLFDIDISKYASYAKETEQAIRANLNSAIHKIALTEQQLQTKISSYKQNVGIRENFTANIASMVASKRTDLDVQKSDLLLLPNDELELVAPKEVLMTELHALENRYHSNTSLINKVNQKRLNLPLLDETCPTCKQAITWTHEQVAEYDATRAASLVELDKELALLEAEALVICLQKDVKEKERNAYMTKYREYSEAQMRFQAINNKKEQLKTSIAVLEKAIFDLHGMECPVSVQDLETIASEQELLTEALEHWQEVKESLEQKVELYKYWATVGFSNKGIKAYIFQALLSKLNTQLRIYGESLGLYVFLDVKTETKSKNFSIEITTLEGVVKAYDELSGGEQKRVDLIVSFALHDLIVATLVAPSFLVMDEVFEGLDESGLDTAMQLIRSKAETCGVYLITHDIKADISFANILNVKSKNNLTYIY